MEAEYVKSLVSTISHLQQAGISYLYLNEYSSQVDAAREATIMGSKFLDAFCGEPLSGKISYDKIFWIDSDISWTPEQFLELYRSKLDIVSGLYFSETGSPVVNVTENGYTHPAFLKNSHEPIEVFATGFGFLAVAQGVFENLSRPWFQTVFKKIEDKDGTKEFYIPYGEDFSWCNRARAAGYSIYLDPRIVVNHYKKMKVET
jgi:hypothetical protein